VLDTRVVRESSRTERFPCSERSRDALVATERNVGSMSGLTEPMCGLSNGDDAVTLSTTVVEDSRRCGQLSRRATSVVSRPCSSPIARPPQGGSRVGDRRQVCDTVACYNFELLLGRQRTSKRDALVQVSELYEGTSAVACPREAMSTAHPSASERRNRTVTNLFATVCGIQRIYG